MKTPICKPLLLSLAIVLAVLPARAQQKPPAAMNSNTIDEVLGDRRADKVPTGDTGRYYLPGAAAGRDSIFPGSYSKQFKIDANFRAGLYNRCGSLDWI